MLRQKLERYITLIIESHQPLITSNSPPPLIQTKAMPDSSRPIRSSGWLSSSVGVISRLGEGEAMTSLSFRIKVMHALTKPPVLNLGRQNGIQDEAAGELKIDGEWIVFMMICRSEFRPQLIWAKIKLRGIPAGCIECFLGLIRVTTRLLAIRITYNMSFKRKIRAVLMNE